ncbi:hypothetical protein F5884DRAFT_422250 [Xylogone sp. PMI_703]|nr:hypothetical protein F5884DRAFT_422250 [Xylogone sp. PMI_703]
MGGRGCSGESAGFFWAFGLLGCSLGLWGAGLTSGAFCFACVLPYCCPSPVFPLLFLLLVLLFYVPFAGKERKFTLFGPLSRILLGKGNVKRGLDRGWLYVLYVHATCGYGTGKSIFQVQPHALSWALDSTLRGCAVSLFQ